MTAADTYELLGAFVDELARCGLRDACTSPGSRCTPLVLTLARERRLRCHSHIDERCSGFFAVGLAKASALPVAIACTSGTAVAELLPAVVEAHEARVPLIVLSADRPPELRDSGAGQTIDQLKIFGGFAKWFFEVGNHPADAERVRWIRTLACRVWWTALEGRPGVVHLNFPLREPLVSDRPVAVSGGRPDGRPLVTLSPARRSEPDDARSLAGAIGGCRRGVVVAGRHERDSGLGEAASAFCAAAGWALLADPLSGARRGEAAVAHYDALLRDSAFAAAVKPEIVLRVGDLPTSKPLRSWLAGMRDVPQALLDPEGHWPDPDSTLCRVFALEPGAAFAQLQAPSVDPDWLAGWRSADGRAAEAILGVLGASALSEPVVAAELGVLLPEEGTLFVASSMPVRDIETFWPARADPPRVLCNRGANGIDGTVSSAFGAAAACTGPVVLLIGDVALAHDLGGLFAAKRLDLKLTIVLLNNEGGGIFDFLAVADSAMARELAPQTDTRLGPRARELAPQTDTRLSAKARELAPQTDTSHDAKADTAEPKDRVPLDLYTQHIATPTGLDFAQAARLYGFEHEAVTSVASFRAALERALASPRSAIVEVRCERTANVDLHRRVWEAVAGVAHL